MRFFWIISSILIAIVSFFGVFITETRGVIVGIGVGVLAFILYAWYAGRNTHLGNRSLARVAGYVLIALVLCGGLFFATKNSVVWQRVPGFDRLANFTFQDNSTQTRLISAGVSLRAVDPSTNGAKKFLLGWGPENFGIAYNANFNPAYFRYENKWFDRAHDKIFDVLVMNGVVGLLVYLGIWGLLFWYGVRERKFSVVKALILFFGVAYFVQNLTVFDSIVTYILWFGFLSYALQQITNNKQQKTKDEDKDVRDKGQGASNKHSNLTTYYLLLTTGTFSIIALFFAYALIFWTIVPFSQMSSFLSLFHNTQAVVSLDDFKQKMDSSLHPYTYAQDVIRTNFLDNVKNIYKGKEGEKQVILFAIDQMKDLLTREPYNPRYWANLGGGYDALGKAGLTEYLPLAQEAYQTAQKLSPKRQDIYYMRAYNLGFQKKYDEAIGVLQEAIALDDQVASSYVYMGLMQLASGEKNYDAGFASFERARQLNPDLAQQENTFISGYYVLLQYYYKLHDARAKICAQALQLMVPEKKEGLDMIIKNIDNQTWQYIQFK